MKLFRDKVVLRLQRREPVMRLELRTWMYVSSIGLSIISAACSGATDVKPTAKAQSAPVEPDLTRFILSSYFDLSKT